MVNNTIHATYTETYDLNTAVGELSVLGLHTPQAGALKKMFHGFFEQYKKYKILGCNLRMVCASQQTLTPDLVGLEAGQVDPRDILNPILFKACTGEHLNALLDMIYNGTGAISSTDAPHASILQKTSSAQAALDCYYQMLADDTFRKSHPQAGLAVSRLIPMVHKVVTTQPFGWTGQPQPGVSGENYPYIGGSNTSDTPVSNSGMGWGSPSDVVGSIGNATRLQGTHSVFVSNGITEMPWLDTAILQNINDGQTSQDSNNGTYLINSVPRVYMGVIVLPPAILQRLFFRMQIQWHIAFRDFRPSTDLGPISAITYHEKLGAVSSDKNYTTYWNMYHSATPTKVAVNEQSSFTTTEGTEVDVVMEKAQ